VSEEAGNSGAQTGGERWDGHRESHKSDVFDAKKRTILDRKAVQIEVRGAPKKNRADKGNGLQENMTKGGRL